MVTAPQSLRRAAVIPHWQGQFAWIIAAAVIGFTESFIFTSTLEVSRNLWVGIHSVVVGTIMYAYTRWANIDLGQVLRRHWVAGIVVGVAVATLLAFLIVNGQTASPRDHGLTFAWEIAWLGIVYGAADALLLSVLPVYAVWQASKDLGHTDRWTGKIGTAVVAMAASLLLTTAYHLGFAEFRNSHLFSAYMGNGIVSVSYLLSGNPITAIMAHIAMHITSVVHGITSTVTLPPHY